MDCPVSAHSTLSLASSQGGGSHAHSAQCGLATHPSVYVRHVSQKVRITSHQGKHGADMPLLTQEDIEFAAPEPPNTFLMQHSACLRA